MGIKTSPLNEENIYLFNTGCNYHSYQLLGAHLTVEKGKPGVRFSVWAPNANEVKVVGDFNDWQGQDYQMEKMGSSGIWAIFVPGIKAGALYKYEIKTWEGDILVKSDPYGFYSELRPNTASIVYDLNNYEWQDAAWREKKNGQAAYQGPLLIYEVHLGSWRRGKDNAVMNYRELAQELPQYAAEMGYTHLELLPLAEHPFDGSWGYQATGYYSLTSRYGTPEDFMYFVDKCHEQGIGVIMDWVPGHFCKDDHGLRCFDGRPLYEPEMAERRENREWGTANFDFGRQEVLSFLISNALFWLDVYHVDGFRVDAVSNILYLDYGRQAGEWIPNKYGGNGNLEGMDFLRRVNEVVFHYYPRTLMIAEEATSWPMVSWPTNLGGLGFNFKWNMGWMNDMLRYMSLDPIHRKWHHNLLTFSLMYAFSENFVLALSHDEVVHGKRSLLDKMPGDYWQKFANLRAFYGYWMAHPGKKLLFMGGEFGQFIEWKPGDSLDWHLVDYEKHQKLQSYSRQLNHFYQQERTFWEIDFTWEGFQWIDCNNYEQSIICFQRKTKEDNDFTIVVCNFTPELREGYQIGVPLLGQYQEVFNSDWEQFGGSGQQNMGVLEAEKYQWHNQPYALSIRIPPLATIYLKPVT